MTWQRGNNSSHDFTIAAKAETLKFFLIDLSHKSNAPGNIQLAQARQMGEEWRQQNTHHHAHSC